MHHDFTKCCFSSKKAISIKTNLSSACWHEAAGRGEALRFAAPRRGSRDDRNKLSICIFYILKMPSAGHRRTPSNVQILPESSLHVRGDMIWFCIYALLVPTSFQSFWGRFFLLFCMPFGRRGTTSDDNGIQIRNNTKTLIWGKPFCTSFWVHLRAWKHQHFHCFFNVFLMGPLWDIFSMLGAKGVPKGCPRGPCWLVWGARVEMWKRWFRENETIILRVGGTHHFWGWMGVPKDLLRSTLCAMFFNMLLEPTFSQFFAVSVPKWEPIGDPWESLFRALVYILSQKAILHWLLVQFGAVAGCRGEACQVCRMCIFWSCSAHARLPLWGVATLTGPAPAAGPSQKLPQYRLKIDF